MLMVFAFLISLPAQQKEREKFDPTVDAAKTIDYGVHLAAKENKRVLLDVGGEWCIWCHRLDEFILADHEIDSTLNANFVVVKVNYSKENKNEAVLNKYPKVAGYPHYFVLGNDGTLLLSKNTGDLEKEKSYDREKLLTFFNEWKVKK